jgi:hypothetical protein
LKLHLRAISVIILISPSLIIHLNIFAGVTIAVIVVVAPIIETWNTPPLDVVTFQPATTSGKVVWVERKVRIQLRSKVIVGSSFTLYMAES